MPTCLLCAREFSQLEIDQGTRVEHAQSGRILLTRFPSGTLHQFDIQKRKPKTLTPRGAFVAAKPVEMPPTPVPIEAPLEEMVAIPATPQAPSEQPQDVDDASDDTGDDTGDDFIVVWMTADDAKGLSRPPIGIARHVSEKKRSRTGVKFRTVDVVTEGLETLKPGSKIRGRVIEPEPGKYVQRLVDIEVYIPGESKQKQVTNVKPVTKIYKHDEDSQ